MAFLVAGCAQSMSGHPPVPAALVDNAVVSDFGRIRYWGDSKPGEYAEVVRERVEVLRRNVSKEDVKTKRLMIGLSVSGGGAAGAYGAGLLVGWTQHGNRPKFDYVSGISTGAMLAPLAFLGPRYDSKIREAYTTLETADVASPQALAAVFGFASLNFSHS